MHAARPPVRPPACSPPPSTVPPFPSRCVCCSPNTLLQAISVFVMGMQYLRLQGYRIEYEFMTDGR